MRPGTLHRALRQSGLQEVRPGAAEEAVFGRAVFGRSVRADGEPARTARIAVSWMIVAILLCGCGTAEYRAARRACHEHYLVAIPPDTVTTTVNLGRYVTTFEPEADCQTFLGQRHCFSARRTKYVPKYDFKTIDRNERRRDDAVWACARDACLESHGNPDCEP